MERNVPFVRLYLRDKVLPFNRNEVPVNFDYQ